MLKTEHLHSVASSPLSGTVKVVSQMASNTTATETPKRKRVKFPAFTPLTDAQLSELVSSGKIRKVEIPAREATAKRKAQPASVQYVADSRAGVLALYGGNEKAANYAASLYLPIATKRVLSKGKVADPFRAVNRTAEAFANMDEELIAKLPIEAQNAIKAMQAVAKANPVAPRARKTKDKTAK